MADFITEQITTYAKQTAELVFKPLFVGKDPMMTQGVRIKQGIASKEKLNYIGKVQKVAKAYSKGFNPATGTTYIQRDIDVVQMKAEMEQDANAFYESVIEELQAKGVDWNDLEKAGSELKSAVVNVFLNGFRADVFRHFWLNDTGKFTLDANGFYTATADTDYNAFKGIWQWMFEKASTTPNYDNGDIFRIAMSNGAVAQIATLTLTGTSGTATVEQGGQSNTATFDTDLTTTAANFVTANATIYAARDITLTSSGADLIFTSSIAGQPFKAPTVTNLTGDLAGSVAATTANTSAAALADDEILGYLDSLHTGCSPVLRSLPAAEKVILMDFYSYDNYVKSLRGFNSTTKFSIESGKSILMNGIEMPIYRGIPVINMDWDVYLNADFAHAAGEKSGYPYRVIYTELKNLVMAIDTNSEFSKFEFWYNKDEQENRFRVQYKMGTNYTHNELTAVAF